MTPLLTLPLQRFVPARYRPGNLGTWSGHLPFANDLVASLHPGLLVELGTHYGESYFGLCQAVQTSQIPCRCFAVDTWHGDQHAGFYADDVFAEVNAYNQQTYASFSTLIRATFDQASAQFERSSIDLLHIDGLHTYSAVKHDFDTWFPKVKPGGIVLLHDITVRHADFEVWRLWDELCTQFPNFAFHHSWGLGVIQKPGGAHTQSEFLRLLFQNDAPTTELIRNEYSDAADLLEYRERSPKTLQAVADAGRPYLQVFPGTKGAGFQETESLISNIEPGVWQQHALHLAACAPHGYLRIDPVNRPALIEISLLTLRDATGSAVIEWNKNQLSRLGCSGQIIEFPGTEGATFFSSGNDPQWILELPPEARDKFPLALEISMRVSFDLDPVRQMLLASPSQAWGHQIAKLQSETEIQISRITALQAEIQALQLDRAHSKAQRNQIEAERQNWHTQAVREETVRTRLEWDLSFAKTQLGDHDRSAAKLREELMASTAERDRLRAELAAKESTIHNLQALSAAHQQRAEALTESLSWRITTPLRAIVGSFLRE